MVDNNAYITVNDLYKDPVDNPFRASKKGEKSPNPIQVKVRNEIYFFDSILLNFINLI